VSTPWALVFYIGVGIDALGGGLRGGGFGAGDQFEVLGFYGFLDGVGGGVDGDLDLLVPELGLVGFDVAVEAVDFVVELEVLLAELERQDGEGHGAEDAEEHFDHWGVLAGVRED